NGIENSKSNKLISFYFLIGSSAGCFRPTNNSLEGSSIFSMFKNNLSDFLMLSSSALFSSKTRSSDYSLRTAFQSSLMSLFALESELSTAILSSFSLPVSNSIALELSCSTSSS
ncbi:9852_t:CDS:1, partial [Cetraspora pellucida]